MSITPGNWSLGKHGGTVVSDRPPPPHGPRRADHAYYGGELIAESIASQADACLIANAKQLFEKAKIVVMKWLNLDTPDGDYRMRVAIREMDAVLDAIIDGPERLAAEQAKSLEKLAAGDVVVMPSVRIIEGAD